MDVGYSTQFDESAVLMHQAETCPNATHLSDFAGCWAMLCHRVDASSTSYAMTGWFGSKAASEPFFLSRSIHPTASGCAGSDTRLVAIEADGHFSRNGSSSSIAGGQVTSLDIFYVTVTPLNSAGAAVLNSECRACNRAWRRGHPDPEKRRLRPTASQRCGNPPIRARSMTRSG